MWLRIWMSPALRFLGPPTGNTYSEEALRAFVDQGNEEGLNLDYKHISAIDNPDSLAQSVTAFANATGGLLALGVEEQKDLDERGNVVRIRPGPITWGPKSLTREKLESMLIARVHPWIHGLRIFPVRNQAAEVLFLIDVPQSPRPPHQAPNKRYYLRYNFQNLPMDHYQIEALFLRRIRPRLRPRLDLLSIAKNAASINLRLAVENSGGALAKHPLLFVQLVGAEQVKKSEGNLFFHIHPGVDEPGIFIVSSQSPIDAIHPNLVHFVGTIEVSLKEKEELFFVILVGAEDMPTTQYAAGLARTYLQGLKETGAKLPLELVALSPEGEAPDEAAFSRFMAQVGIEWQRFMEALAAVDPSNPESVQRALESLGEHGD